MGFWAGGAQMPQPSASPSDRAPPRPRGMRLTWSSPFRRHSGAPVHTRPVWVPPGHGGGQQGPGPPRQQGGGCSLPGLGASCLPRTNLGGFHADTQGRMACSPIQGSVSPRGRARRPCPGHCPACGPNPPAATASKGKAVEKQQVPILGSFRNTGPYARGSDAGGSQIGRAHV